MGKWWWKIWMTDPRGWRRVVIQIRSFSSSKGTIEQSHGLQYFDTKVYIRLLSIFYFMFFIHFIIPLGKFGPPYLGKATAAARAAPHSPTNAYWVFSCFRNPPINSDIDYRIFNVRDPSCVCVYTWGLGTLTRQHNILTPINSHKFFLCSWWDSNLGSLDPKSDTLPIELPGCLPTPSIISPLLWRTPSLSSLSKPSWRHIFLLSSNSFFFLLFPHHKHLECGLV